MESADAEPTNREGRLCFTLLHQYNELEHLQILVSAGRPETNTPVDTEGSLYTVDCFEGVVLMC